MRRLAALGRMLPIPPAVDAATRIVLSRTTAPAGDDLIATIVPPSAPPRGLTMSGQTVAEDAPIGVAIGRIVETN